MNRTPTLRGPGKRWLTGCLLLLGCMGSAVQADGLDKALAGGTPSLDMRLRFERVDDSTNKNAKAATLRTRLGYGTGIYHGFSAYGEFEHVRAVAGIDDYAPLRSGHATVADPKVTQLNQAYLDYSGLPDSRIKLGRQRLILDNARFVGNVGWRQNEQTFDAVSVINKTLANTSVTYAYLDKVKGILSKFDANVDDHLINVRYDRFEGVRLTAYAYLLKDEGSGAKNNTYGLRAKGKTAVGSAGRLLYTAELASQSTEDNDARYIFLEAGLALKGVTARLGYEMLGSDNGKYGLQTPLATKHAFNGWADMFLSTPAEGLRDWMLSLGGRLGGARLLAVYHDFNADRGSTDYGSEVDLLAVRNFGNRYQLGIKYAGFNADSWKTDTDKFWLWGQLKI